PVVQLRQMGLLEGVFDRQVVEPEDLLEPALDLADGRSGGALEIHPDEPPRVAERFVHPVARPVLVQGPAAFPIQDLDHRTRSGFLVAWRRCDCGRWQRREAGHRGSPCPLESLEAERACAAVNRIASWMRSISRGSAACSWIFRRIGEANVL